MGEARSGMRGAVFAAWVALILGAAAVQSVAHLDVVLDRERIDTLLDLDRSNGVPDLVSTLALVSATGAAVSIARDNRGRRRVAAWALAAALGSLTLADLLHDGPHPAAITGWLVTAIVVGTGILLVLVAATSGGRTRLSVAVGGSLLLGSFLVNALDRLDQRFERERGDPIREYEIVSKEGLELLGWSLVALALWDEARRRRAGWPRTMRSRVERG